MSRVWEKVGVVHTFLGVEGRDGTKLPKGGVGGGRARSLNSVSDIAESLINGLGIMYNIITRCNSVSRLLERYSYHGYQKICSIV